METNILTRYYQYIIDLVVEVYNKEFRNAKPGHCMKITGLGNEQLLLLWERLTENFSNLDIFIVDEDKQERRYISATKLIELRNQQNKPLLILVPSNSRTAAEDSYGNATFKEISLELIEPKLIEKLKQKLPTKIVDYVNKIIDYLIPKKRELVNYLLAIEEEEYTKNSIGKNLFYLGLLPDLKLLENEEQVRSRLNLNLTSCNTLTSFNKPIYERVDELQIDKDSLQKHFVELFRVEHDITSLNKLVKVVKEKYPNLWFDKWKVPELNFEKIKLEILEIRSTDFVIEDGRKVLLSDGNKSNNVTIRFKTTPEPKDIEELKYFRIILMSVDGFQGQEITTIRKLKNTASKKAYREARVELNANNIDEGSYFFKVLAEDELGNILNSDDDFYEDSIQKEWAESDYSSEKKEELPYKLKCDSEDFDYFIDINTEKEETIRKDKLNNALQAFFKYNIERLRQQKELESPIPSESSNIWLNDNRIKQSSIFHINYSSKHNYQIPLSSKLRLIENEILNNGKHLGFLNVTISNNSTTLGLERCSYKVSNLTEISPKKLLESRQSIFEKIKKSNSTENGVLETVNLYDLKEDIKNYVELYNDWLVSLNKKMEKSEISEKDNIKLFYTEIQFLDTIKVKTELPTGGSSSVVLLSPLHPLRLAWFLNLLEQFEKWYDKTIQYKEHISEWTKLESLFLGEFNPSNSPIAIVDPNQFINYEYLGELCFGWGIYVNTEGSKSEDSLIPMAYQLKYYFRHLLNIDSKNIVNNDVSRKLVIKHIKNFLIQHPYTNTLIINLFNVGGAEVFADAFVELNKYTEYSDTKFEVRIFIGQDSLIEHGLALKSLINPETTISEEAELFSQPSKNRLFPKLRFSINNIEDFMHNPVVFNAHISFLVNPFSAKVTLYKPYEEKTYKSTYLNSLIIDFCTDIDYESDKITWLNYTEIEKSEIKDNLVNKIFISYQNIISGSLAAHKTDAIPATKLSLTNRDKVLLAHLHEYSNWVITFDKNLGPQIFDQPSDNGKIPFLLDYIPGEEVSGISSYLTTKPSNEVVGLLSPHFESFINSRSDDFQNKIQVILEDLRAISSSLVLQLNSSKNKAFEAIGTAFSKRVLEKKGLLKNAFLIPIDLHQNLFENISINSKSRADNLFISIDKKKREIKVAVLEIKCRSYLGETEREELKFKMVEQINNTITAIQDNFDPNNFKTEDRLDRELKNKELKTLLQFYIERAYRYNILFKDAYNNYIEFIQSLNEGFEFKFSRVGFIFDFSFDKKHQKQKFNDDITIFTFGKELISDILNPDSDLNTQRLEDTELNNELNSVLDTKNKLNPIIRKIKSKIKSSEKEENLAEPITVTSTELDDDNGTNSLDIEAEETASNKMYKEPDFDIVIGKSSPSSQYGIIGTSVHNKKIAIDLSETNTISLFGVQGGGKSYTIGTVSEMVLKQFSNINKLPSPLAAAIFHYSESMDYEPEFTSMIHKNTNLTEIEKLKTIYNAEPDSIEDVIILTPSDKVDERREEFPSIQVEPIAFNSKELNVQDWMFLLGAVGNDSSYIKQLKFMMKEQRKNITLEGLRNSVEESELLSNSQKSLAKQKLNFAEEYIDDNIYLRDVLKPGKLIIVDLRDEFIVKDEALGLFVIMLNIFSSIKTFNGKHFNKFIVFDEAHKYMDNKDLTNNIVTAIREMRHKGVSVMIASQDPPSLPNEIIELSSIVLLHKFNSPQWLKHIQKSLTQLNHLTSVDLSILKPGEGFLWASKASEPSITIQPVKISTRPRVTQHGGATKNAIKD